VTENINPEFFDALLAEDDVGCVIRSHLYVEAQINRYLELAVVDQKYLRKLNLNYAKKVELLCCLGFDAKFREALKKIGSVRNKFAHDISFHLSREVVKDLYNLLPEFGRQAVEISLDVLNQHLTYPVSASRYQDLEPKLQLVLIVLNLERICCAACDLLQKAKTGSG
jgi:hypothetical protein